MRTLTLPARLASLCARLMIATCLAGATQAANWPTTRFKVDFRPVTGAQSTGREDYVPTPEPGRQPTLDPRPGEAAASAEDSEGSVAAHAVLALYFEESLQDAAEFFAGRGFEPPQLPLLEDDSGTYFKINVFDFKNDRRIMVGRYYEGKQHCGDAGISDSALLTINAKRFVPLTTSMEAYLYIALAHELGHAIQYNYPTIQDAIGGCYSNTKDARVVREGTANALAFTAAARHWPEWYLVYNKFHYPAYLDEDEIVDEWTGSDGFVAAGLIGFRSYQVPFLDYSAYPGSKTNKDMATYESSSFWLNVTERYGLEFIDFLYRQPLAYGDNPSLFKWLDDALKAYRPDTHGLYTVFPHFVTEFASVMGSRIPFDRFRGWTQTVLVRQSSLAGTPFVVPRTKQEQWLKGILGDCKAVELVGAQAETVEISMTLNKVSAGCIDLRWKGFRDSFELDIEAEHESLRLLDQIHVGLAYQKTLAQEMYCYNQAKKAYHEALWTCLHEKPFPTTGREPLKYHKQFYELGETFAGEGRRIIVVSNVAREAERTRAIAAGEPLLIRIGTPTTEAGDGRVYEPAARALKGGAAASVPGMTPENLYGIATSPAPAGTLMTFSVSMKGSDRAYGVAWMGKEPPLGYTGPFRGTVSANTGMPAVTSVGCTRHRDGVVGQITRYDRDHLWIEIDADLCEMTIPPPPDGNYPRVDAVKATLRLPFGWRYDPGTTPADIVTPGMHAYIGRYNKRLPMVLAGNWPPVGSSPDAGAPPGGPGGTSGTGGGGGGPGSGPGGSSAVGSQVCACTCAELAAAEAQAEQLGARATSGDRQTASAVMGLMQCTNQCQREYMICRLEQDQAQRQARAEQKAAEAQQLRDSCSCTCDELAATDRRGRELQQRQAAGEAISVRELTEVVGCYQVCNTEYTACRLADGF